MHGYCKSKPGPVEEQASEEVHDSQCPTISRVGYGYTASVVTVNYYPLTTTYQAPHNIPGPTQHTRPHTILAKTIGSNFIHVILSPSPTLIVSSPRIHCSCIHLASDGHTAPHPKDSDASDQISVDSVH